MRSKILLAALLLSPAGAAADIPPVSGGSRSGALGDVRKFESKRCGAGETRHECAAGGGYGLPACESYGKDPSYALLAEGWRTSYYCRKAENWSKLSPGQRLSRVRDFLRDLKAAEASAPEKRERGFAAQDLVARFPAVEREVATLEKKAKKSSSEAAVLKDAVSSLKLRGRVAALGGGDVEAGR